jgi:hypothetical protein
MLNNLPKYKQKQSIGGFIGNRKTYIIIFFLKNIQ